MQFFPPFVSVAFAALSLALLAPNASAQELKTVYDPALAGGVVFVEGILHVRFVGDERSPIRPQVLTTAWRTYALHKVRAVIVTEERMTGQPEDQWKVERLALVAKVAAAFPAITKPATWTTSEPATSSLILRPHPRARVLRRVSALERPVLQPFELPQPFTILPAPRLQRLG